MVEKEHPTTYLSNAVELIGVALLLFCWAATTAASLDAVLAPPNELPNWAATEDAAVLFPVPTPLAPDPVLATDIPPAPLPVTEVLPPPPADDVPYLRGGGYGVVNGEGLCVKYRRQISDGCCCYSVTKRDELVVIGPDVS